MIELGENTPGTLCHDRNTREAIIGYFKVSRMFLPATEQGQSDVWLGNMKCSRTMA